MNARGRGSTTGGATRKPRPGGGDEERNKGMDTSSPGSPDLRAGCFTTGEIIENRPLAPGHFLMVLRLPLAFATPVPGQFVMIRSRGHEEPLLPRPLSVYGFNRQDGCATLDLLYRVTGRGTALFSRMKPGETLSVLGPLGSGFTVPEGVKKIILVAGGVGVAPLAYFVQERLRGEEVGGPFETTAYLGAGSGALLTGGDRLSDRCDLRLCTDDGSRGYCGTVTELLRRDVGGFRPEETVLFGCGPTPMIRSLRRVLGDIPMRCQVSLEERMACGLGACLGCAVAIRSGSGGMQYRRVCKDGPVFDLRELAFLHPRVA
jgi:dihydroorotate dehydrogenase electron transfer subunit